MRHSKLLAYLLCGCLFLTACAGGQSTGASSSEQQAESEAEETEAAEEPQAEGEAEETEAAEDSQAEPAAEETGPAEDSQVQGETGADDAAPAAEENASGQSAEASSADAAATGSTQAAKEGDKSVVYFTGDISPEGLVNVYEALGWTPTGKVAVKISTGEPPASNYLRPELIKDLVTLLDGTIVECNTAYGGSRAATAEHYQVAEDHGFMDIADFKILDEDGYMEIPVTGGTRLTGDLVGKAFTDYDSYVILSHFKGHQMAGFGGAIKNSSIGLASSRGKVRIHSGGTSDTRWHDELQLEFLESMAEANSAVQDALGDRIIYINVMNRISIDCDCDGHPEEPDIHDIGILASYDPVALDQACVDLALAADGSERLKERIEDRQGLHTLEHAEEIKLGSREYELKSIDE